VETFLGIEVHLQISGCMLEKLCRELLILLSLVKCFLRKILNCMQDIKSWVMDGK